MKLAIGGAAAVLIAGAAFGTSVLPSASLERGRVAFQKCYACHALEPGKKLEGPSLHRIVGRRIAAERGFPYSPALKALAKRKARWDPALLDRFIADPEQVAPRTSMNFHGIGDRRERAALIAYLRRTGRR